MLQNRAIMVTQMFKSGTRISRLHATSSSNMYPLFEINCSHESCFIGVGHELRVMFSKAEDEAWSQHKHLHNIGN